MGGDEFAVLFWDTGQPREVYAHEENNEANPDGTAGGQGGSPCEATRVSTPLQQHPEMAVFLSNRFRRIMNTNEFPSLGTEARGTLTISGGLACFPWDGDTVEQLLAKADEALLNAKRSGKNRIYLVGRPGDIK
jgi:GGDEF domain-containing protein